MFNDIRELGVDKHNIPCACQTLLSYWCDCSVSPYFDSEIITYSGKVWQNNSEVKPA